MSKDYETLFKFTDSLLLWMAENYIDDYDFWGVEFCALDIQDLGPTDKDYVNQLIERWSKANYYRS